MLTFLPGILIAISVHELAHGYMAYLQGDNTAKLSGRLTLDPLAHIDPVGFLMLLFLGFGWAKPVPVNYARLKNGRLGIFLVAIAGSVVNLLVAFAASFLYVLAYKLDLHQVALNVVMYVMLFNLVLGVFNLIPVPPLDGFKVLSSVLPYNVERKLMQFERYGYMVLVILLLTGGVSRVIGPVIFFFQELFMAIASNLIG